MNAQRVLLTWGIVWILIWLCQGFYLGPQVFPTRDAKKTHFVEALKQVSAGDSQKAEEELTEGLKTENNFRHQVGMHSHALCLAFLALFVGLMQPFLGLSEKIKSIFAWFLVAGSFLHEVGTLTEFASLTAAMPILLIANALVIISVIVTFVGVLKYVSPGSESV
jgi:hypothetical protein